jgi:hypothetical protein
MKRSISILLQSLALLCFISSCKKDTPEVPATPKKVYIGGNISTSITSVPAFWEGTTPKSPTKLAAVGRYSYVYSCFEDGADIYYAGSDGPSIAIAKYWKNESPVALTSGTYTARINKILAVGGVVYAAGYEYNASNTSVAKFWKNGTPLSLTFGSYDAVATSIFISGNDIYVSGYEYNAAAYKVAKYWKNGISIALTNGTKTAECTDILVSGTDVFALGYESSTTSGSANYVAKLWKNGVPTSLTDGTSDAYPKRLAVSGSDIIVVGYEYPANGKSIAKMWKNNTETRLSDGTNYNYARDIFVDGTDIYIAGDEYNSVSTLSTPKYWKNGVANNLDLSSGFTSGQAYSIFVK